MRRGRGARPDFGRGAAGVCARGAVRVCARSAAGVVALVAAAGALGGGCATVAPYERERLAGRDMALGGSPELGRAEGHATEVREGAVGGLGGAGGGCGCN
jgi:hypothetical protein